MSLLRCRILEVSTCHKGGGGGGGSGKVEYPAHITTWHSMALDDSGVDTLTSSMTDIMDAAIGNSPWTGETAYDPDTELVTMLAAPDDLKTLVDLLSQGNTLDTLIASVLDQSRIDDTVIEYAADFDARLVSDILPRFEAGMRDINAVTSSAFAIGKAIIEENQDRQIAKFSADLHMKAFSDDTIQVISLKLQYQQSVSQMIAETNRVKIVAKKEENDGNLKIEENDATWDLEVFQYGANLLAAPGGGTESTGSNKPSTAQSVIGGAMAGAAAGAMVPGLGPLVGGLLGAASGLL